MSVVNLGNGKFILAWPAPQSEIDSLQSGYYGAMFWNTTENEIVLGNGEENGAIPQMRRDMANSFNIETLSGTKILTAQDKPKQRLNPDGADKDISLPDPATRVWFEIKNPAGATGNLVVKHDVTTIATITPGSSAALYSDGSAWAEY